MATSFTGEISTQGNFVDLETASGVTFTTGNSYTIQIQNTGYLKLNDAIFTIYTDTPFTYNAGTDTLYIKTEGNSCLVTILENSQS